MNRQETPFHNGIILFTRYPQPGKVKTRLINALGENGAAQTHRVLTEHIINRIQPVTRQLRAHLSIYYTGGTEQQMRDWLGENISLREQCGQTLGRRMAEALRNELENGAAHAVLIGSDCPSIDPQLLQTAFEELDRHDLVIGPTFDGGYYLLGAKSTIPGALINSLFENISWGTSAVYAQTVERAEKAQLSLYPLPQYHDIDRPEDLEYFYHNSNT